MLVTIQLFVWSLSNPLIRASGPGALDKVTMCMLIIYNNAGLHAYLAP